MYIYILIICAVVFIGSVYLLWRCGKDIKVPEQPFRRSQNDISTKVIKPKKEVKDA